MSTLYRKYRPQTFSDLLGQEHLTQTITNEIATGRLAHAYLFSGPRGIGKTTLARLIAKAINCQNRKEGKFEPCNECSSCKEITEGRNIDVMEIDAASHTGVDNVRENIIDSAQFHPSHSKYKIFIIDEVHMLSTPAFNALLKTLEEPPAHMIFILATTEWHKIPATIISRCQRFNFQKISPDLIAKKMQSIAEEEGVKVEPAVIKRIIGKSDGCLRDAESLLGQILSLDLKKITAKDIQSILPSTDIEQIINFLEALAEKNPVRALELIEEMVAAGTNLEQFALDLIEILRAIMIMRLGQKDLRFSDLDDSSKKKLKELAEKFSSEETIHIMETVMRRRLEMKQSPIPQLPLELMAIELTSERTNSVSDGGQPSAQGRSQPKADEPRAHASNKEKKITESTITETVVEERLPKPVEVPTSSPSIISFADIQNRWPELIEKLSEENHSLIFVLKMAELKNWDGQYLTFTVPYSFHKEKIDEKKSKTAIENCLKELLKEKIIISCEVALQTQPDETAVPDKALTELATDFGGEFVS